MDRIKSYLLAFIFVSLTSQASEYMDRARVEVAPANIMKYSEVVQAIDRLSKSTSKLMYSYVIWVFHSVIMTLLFMTGINFVSGLLFFVEAIVFCIQLYQWLKEDSEVYKSIRKTWKLLFYLIVINTVYRWLTYVPQ